MNVLCCHVWFCILFVVVMTNSISTLVDLWNTQWRIKKKALHSRSTMFACVKDIKPRKRQSTVPFYNTYQCLPILIWKVMHIFTRGNVCSYQAQSLSNLQPTGCPKAPGINYHYSLHINPEECSSQMHRILWMISYNMWQWAGIFRICPMDIQSYK